MKIVVIGDTHGRNFWKLISHLEKDCDKFIFIGDYFDSFDINANEQIMNFQEIMKFKEENPDKVICLIGNHDCHYHPSFIEFGERYSGFQGGAAYNISHLIQAYKDNMQMCYSNNGIYFTHAGITQTWLKNVGFDFEGEQSVEEFINELWKFKPLAFGFDSFSKPYCDPYGDDIFQSPIWVRPKSLDKDGLVGAKQIVGHTQVNEITKSKMGNYLIDVLGTSQQYLTITNGKIEIKTL